MRKHLLHLSQQKNKFNEFFTKGPFGSLRKNGMEWNDQ